MKKLNLLFDANVIRNILEKDSSRSGIFFASYNILLEFIKSDKFNIYLYCNINNYVEICNIIKKVPELNSCKAYLQANFLEKIIAHNIDRLRKNKKGSKNKLIKYTTKTEMLGLKFLMLFVKLKRYFFQPKYDLDQFNIYVSSMEEIPVSISKSSHINKYTILYDCIPVLFPDYFPAVKKGSYWFLDLLKSINNKDYYFAISDNTKQDFIKFAPNIDPAKITTTLLAAGENFYSCKDENKLEQAKKKYNIPENKKYLFSLCSLEPRKNLIMAVKAFIAFIKKHNIDDFVYVLGGGAWKGFAEKMEQEIPDFDIYKDKIIKAGYVDDEDLASLYSNAEFFVYTSEYEGFGLPPLEAMKCGKAVITSNNSSLPEVVGDAGIMIDFDSIEQHIQAYESLYFDKELRKSYERKGLEQSAKFSWHKCADVMIKEMINNASTIENIKL